MGGRVSRMMDTGLEFIVSSGACWKSYLGVRGAGVNAHKENTSSHEHTCPVSLVDPHRHRHCSAAYRAVALRKPLAARPAHALVATRDEDMRLGLVQAHDARLAVGIVHRISRCPLLGDLVD